MRWRLRTDPFIRIKQESVKKENVSEYFFSSYSLPILFLGFLVFVWIDSRKEKLESEKQTKSEKTRSPKRKRRS